jgi:hypothetical protein
MTDKRIPKRILQYKPTRRREQETILEKKQRVCEVETCWIVCTM